ncbi:MAG: carph-isopro domain-containing protein [Alphaproteobacteria bacterium]
MSAVIDRIIAKFGSQAALAEAAGVSQPSVAGWRKHGLIPSRRQAAVLAAARARGIALEPADFFDEVPAAAPAEAA